MKYCRRLKPIPFPTLPLKGREHDGRLLGKLALMPWVGEGEGGGEGKVVMGVKIVAGMLIALGLVTMIVPSLFTCAAHGKAIQLPGGGSVPMKCLWTARAEMGVGAVLLVVGVFLFLGRELESRRAFSILALVVGILIILLPTALIGVCVNPDMPCVRLMKPILLLVGVVAAALSLAASAWSLASKT